MYSNFRSLLLYYIPGMGISDYIYLGMLIFIIADFFSHRKWGPFIITVIFSIAFKAADYILLNQASGLVIEQFLHMIFLPLVLSFLYTKRS